LVGNDLISVVIPCYNDASYIEQALNSVRGQTYKNIEVIVVDDGSNDKTKSVLIGLQNEIDCLLHQENLGQSTARNNGIKKANGEYILTLDSDDYFEHTFFEKALNIFNQNAQAKLVTCFTNLFFDDSSKNHIYEPKGGDIKSFLTYNGALGSAMFKKEHWVSVGGYDESMRNGLEDWEFYIRLLSKGGTAEVIKEPLYNYRKRENTTTSRANKKKYELYKYIYFKNKDIYINNFEIFVNQLLLKIEKEEKEKIKNISRLEYKIGDSILKPLRWIKNLLK